MGKKSISTNFGVLYIINCCLEFSNSVLVAIFQFNLFLIISIYIFTLRKVFFYRTYETIPYPVCTMYAIFFNNLNLRYILFSYLCNRFLFSELCRTHLLIFIYFDNNFYCGKTFKSVIKTSVKYRFYIILKLYNLCLKVNCWSVLFFYSSPQFLLSQFRSMSGDTFLNLFHRLSLLEFMLSIFILPHIVLRQCAAYGW